MDPKKIKSKFLGVFTSAWIEIFSFFAIVSIGALLSGSSINFFNVCPHPFWIVVILTAAQYGTTEALIAAAIATAIFFLGPIPQQTILQDRFAYFFFLVKTPLMWFVAALILGELRMRHIRKTDLLEKKAMQSEEKEKAMAESYTALKKIKERLEIQIASDRQTTLEIIKEFKEMEKSDLDALLHSAMDMIKTLVAPEKFSVFLLEKDRLKLVASEGWQQGDHFDKEFPVTAQLFQEIITYKRVIQMNTSDPKILDKQGVLAVPVVSEEDARVFGMIKIEQIPFLRLRIKEIESLRSIGQWVGTAYGHYLKKEGENNDAAKS